MTGDGIPTEIVATLTATWRAWSALGAELDESEWKTPTDLPGWSVQDNLAHIVGVERLLEGLPAAPVRPAVAGGEPHVRNPLGEFNENEVAARRHLPGAAVLAEWDELRTRREHTLSVADAAWFAQPAVTPVGPGTMTDFLSIRILDCWVHEQDARRALDRPGNDDGPAAAHSIDRLLRSVPMVVGKRAACPEGRAVELRLTGPVRRRLVCEVREGRAVVVDEPTRPPLAAVVMDSQAYVMLANGRRPATELGDRVEVTAADAEGESVGRLVAGSLNVMQ